MVASKDKNSDEDRYNIGIVQGFSELADQIGEAKGVELTKTLPNETRFIVKILKIVVFAGALLVLWIFFVRPAVTRIKNGK